MSQKKRSRETVCIQGGWQPKSGEPRVLPIYQSTTFKYDDSDKMGRLFDLEDEGYFYTRFANPTNDAVASKICELEGRHSRDADVFRTGSVIFRHLKYL